MLIHHLFAFNMRITNVTYKSIMTISKPFTIEYYIAVFGRICVPIYLFVGGYGLYIKYNNFNYSYKEEYKIICKRIYSLLKIYWSVFIIFIPLGVIMNKINLELPELIKNFFTLSYSYNAEWWFLNTYILLLLLFPLIKKIISKSSKKQIIIIFGMSYIMSILSGKLLSYNIIPVYSPIRLLMQAVAQQSTFIMGCICCKFKVFDKLYEKLELKDINNIFVNLLIISLIIIIRNLESKLDIILLPIFIYSSLMIINKFKLNKLFKYLGDHSTNLWLTHSFFCYYYFQRITFMPKYSILIVIWLLGLCLLSSYLIKFIFKLINKISLSKKEYAMIS